MKIFWAKKIIILVFIILSQGLYASDAINPVDNFRTVPQHGYYSLNYQKDWSNMPMAKEYPRKNFSEYTFIDGDGEYLQKRINGEKKVHLKNIALKVRWKNPYNKYDNALYVIRGAEQVTVENIAIVQLDSDYRASHSILIEDSKTVIIRNSYFSGTTNNYHIRVEGCENVFIDNVEIAGFNYGDKGIRSGGGILVNNGDPKSHGTRGMVTPNPFDLKWLVVQNCYVHDNLDSDKWRNQDGILIQSASDGILFNCYFENWGKGDAPLDVSHRRIDSAYRNHAFRVERNLFINSNPTKTPGYSDPSCKIIFTNNLYINTSIIDYHKGWDVYHIHESYIFNNDYPNYMFFKLWEIRDGLTYFSNCLLYVFDERLYTVYHQSGESLPDDYKLLKLDYFVYLMPEPTYWLKAEKFFINNWREWRRNNVLDNNSYFGPPENPFKNFKQNDFRLNSNSIPEHFGSPIYLDSNKPAFKVDKDFYGKSRYPKPSAGAFEVY